MKVSINFIPANPVDKKIIDAVEAVKFAELERGRKTSNATAITMLLSCNLMKSLEIVVAGQRSFTRDPPIVKTRIRKKENPRPANVANQKEGNQ